MGSKLDSGLPLSRACTFSFLAGCLSVFGSAPYSSSRPAYADCGDDRMRVLPAVTVVKIEERTARLSALAKSVVDESSTFGDELLALVEKADALPEARATANARGVILML